MLSAAGQQNFPLWLAKESKYSAKYESLSTKKINKLKKMRPFSICDCSHMRGKFLIFIFPGACPCCFGAKTGYTLNMSPVLALANSKSSKQPFRFTPKGNLEFAKFAMGMFLDYRRKPENPSDAQCVQSPHRNSSFRFFQVELMSTACSKSTTLDP